MEYSRIYNVEHYDPYHDLRDMPTQARNLVNKMKADSTIDFDNDWKMVTLFIGGNNLCDFCNDLVSNCSWVK